VRDEDILSNEGKYWKGIVLPFKNDYFKTLSPRALRGVKNKKTDNFQMW
jgi:hypothetical protein